MQMSWLAVTVISIIVMSIIIFISIDTPGLSLYTRLCSKLVTYISSFIPYNNSARLGTIIPILFWGKT